MIEFAAGFCVFVVVTLGGLLLRTRAKLRRMRFVCAGYERGRAEALAVLDALGPLSHGKV